MAFCPEDGTEMQVVSNKYDFCYTCPKCGTHWLYSEGKYEAGPIEECPNCVYSKEV